ncbi:peptidoglycan DD-metalloendopeptidase family protein, partial [Limibaculum sp. M0105]
LAATLAASGATDPAPAADAPKQAAPFAGEPTPLPLPVAGRVVGGYGSPDPWGRRGSGLTFSAPAWAEVRAPVDATVRYAGPLADYGQVAILEPGPRWLIVMAGLGRVTRAPGDTVLAGEPVGDLGGLLPASEEFLLEASGKDGEILDRKLYIEVRLDGDPVDPTPWFGNGDKRGP